MLLDKLRFSLRKRLYHILIIALFTLIPLNLIANDEESAERRAGGDRKGDAARPAGSSPSGAQCPQCQARGRNLQRTSDELESKKKEWAEIQNDIKNEGEYRRELAVKEKGREFLKDDPNIGREIDALKARIDGIPERKAGLPSLEDKIRELEGRKAALEREVKECEKKCREPSYRLPLKLGLGLSYDPKKELGPPVVRQPRPPVPCPLDCRSAAEQLKGLRAELETKRQKADAIEAARQPLVREYIAKKDELNKLKAMEQDLSKDRTPEGERARADHRKRCDALEKELSGLKTKTSDSCSEQLEIANETRGLKERIRDLEDCEKKCKGQPGTPPKKAVGSPGLNGIKPGAACPDCTGAAGELDRARAEREKAKEKMRSIEEDMELINKDIEKKIDDLEDLEAWSGYVSEEFKARAEYMRRRAELNEDIDKLEEMWHRKHSEFHQIERETSKVEARIRQLGGTLEDCNRKCPGPGRDFCPPVPFKPLEIGPQSKYGSGASNTAKDVAKNVLGGLIGGLFGGGGGSPGSTGGPADRPPLDPNPFQQMGTFTDSGTGTAIRLAGRQTDTGMLLATGIEKGGGKPTIHSITLHRDDDCSVMMPDQYFLYELYLNWHLSVTWTRTTYVDNQVVKRESGGWSSGGSELIGRGIFAASQGGAGSIWQQFGFDRATGGPKTVGAEFKGLAKGSAAKSPDKAVVHITRPDQDPVTTVPFVFNVAKRADGTLDFKHLPASVAPRIIQSED